MIHGAFAIFFVWQPTQLQLLTEHVVVQARDSLFWSRLFTHLAAQKVLYSDHYKTIWRNYLNGTAGLHTKEKKLFNGQKCNSVFILCIAWSICNSHQMWCTKTPDAFIHVLTFFTHICNNPLLLADVQEQLKVAKIRVPTAPAPREVWSAYGEHML